MASDRRPVSWGSTSFPVPSPASGSKKLSVRGVAGSCLSAGGRKKSKDAVGVTGGGAIERTSRPLGGKSGSSRVGSACRLGLNSSTLTEGNPNLAVDFRLLLLAGCLAFEREVERFIAEGLSVLQEGHRWRRQVDSAMRAYLQSWYPTRVFLEEKANNFHILQVRLQAFSLEK